MAYDLATSIVAKEVEENQQRAAEVVRLRAVVSLKLWVQRVLVLSCAVTPVALSCRVRRLVLGGAQASKLAELTEKDAHLLEAKSAGLRQYLMDNVVPQLAQGLQDVISTNPSDYVDHLVCVCSLHGCARASLCNV